MCATTANNNVCCDLLKFENINKEFKKYTDYDLRYKKRATNHKNYTEYYNNKLIQKVKRIILVYNLIMKFLK